VIGTYSYMSPEQALGRVDDMDERSDVFGLGSVLYFILTGRPPYRADTQEETLALAQTREVKPPEAVEDSVPRVLAEVAMKAMSSDPQNRYQTVDELKAEIEEVLRGRWRFPVARFAAGTVIVEEGEVGNEAYVIRSGRCEVYRTASGRKVSLGILGPGEVFGETAVFTGQPRNASVRAIDDTELWVVAGKAMLKELGMDSWMGAFVSSLGRRFSELNKNAARLQARIAQERILRETFLAVALHGRPGEKKAREVEWKQVLDVVGRTVDCSEEELLQIVQNAPCLEYRKGEPDLLTLREEP
jgi:serine/threonine-protein kinase